MHHGRCGGLSKARSAQRHVPHQPLQSSRVTRLSLPADCDKASRLSKSERPTQPTSTIDSQLPQNPAWLFAVLTLLYSPNSALTKDPSPSPSSFLRQPLSFISRCPPSSIPTHPSNPHYGYHRLIHSAAGSPVLGTAYAASPTTARLPVTTTAAHSPPATLNSNTTPVLIGLLVMSVHLTSHHSPELVA